MRDKVLFILHIPPPIHGAAMVGKYIQESRIINSSFDVCYINLSTSESLNEIGKGGFGKILTFLRIQLKVIQALRNKEYELYYMTLTTKGPGFYKDFLVVILLKLFGKRIIYHFHNKGVSLRNSKRLNHILYTLVFKNSKIILLSEFLYSDIEKYVAKTDVYFCANGIPLNDNAVNVPGKSNHGKPLRLLFLSNMMEAKGVLVLLEACRILNEKGIIFECHFVGDWSDVSAKSFDNVVATKNLKKLIFAHGKKFNFDKYNFLLNSDIFIHPILNDCFPLVLLEAMQFGLPIISTPEGGIPDVVVDGETGFLVPQKDAIALAEKIELLINHPELRKRMGDAGKRRYEEFFTLEKFENNLCEILNQAIESE